MAPDTAARPADPTDPADPPTGPAGTDVPPAEPRDLVEVTEGLATVLVPEGSTADKRHTKKGRRAVAGPARIDEGGLFYNPSMRFGRDLTLLVVEARADAHRVRRAARKAERLARGDAPYDPGPYRFFDGLGATGVRGVRMAKESRVPVHAYVNDRNEEACALARRNADMNDVADRVTVTNRDFALALGDTRVDHVDIDPFGSPAPFLDAAVQRVRDHGVVAVTATDMTALCGIYPRVCRRRYDAAPWHGPAMHEVAIRIVAGAVVRTGAKHDLAFRPILAHATDHYVRIFLTMRRGAQRADEAITKIGHAVEELHGTRRLIGPGTFPPGDARRVAGPLLTGTLQDTAFVDDLLARLEDHDQLDRPPLARFLERAREEADAAPLYYTMKEWGKRLKLSPPPREVFFDALREDGWHAARAHVAGDNFKTDAPADAIAVALHRAAKGRGA